MHGKLGYLAFFLACLVLLLASAARAGDDDTCLACHSDKTMTTQHGKQTVSIFVDGKKFSASVHAPLSCTGCHADLEGKDIPHPPPAKVDCGTCHADEKAKHAKSLHGKALARGDPLAPRCFSCHGNHDIVPVKDPRSPVAPLKVPFTCGKCHQEGTAVSRLRNIPEHDILENFSESIHGQGLLKRGLTVAPNCASCHTAHSILPHTDPESSIARKNIAATCTKCHSQIEAVHRKTIRGEMWEKQANVLPACIDCHQPHKIRRVFYAQGAADADCLRCHSDEKLKSSDGRPLFVKESDHASSRHSKIACSQCHSEVNISHERPCETIKKKVDCTSCHAEVGQQYQRSVHGQLFAKNNPIAPTCKDCHGTHRILGKHDTESATFPTNVPELCARCHREGKKAAVAYKGQQHEIIGNYTESIHGKGLLKSGLTVTATCTSCHTAHRELPASDPESTVNPRNIPTTCGVCHHGIQEQFVDSVHSTSVTHTDKELPVCSSCHTAHTIQRADQDTFKLEIMNRCGRCHEAITAAYFDTYHGKVSRLGYTNTAKCFDCHGSHDIRRVGDPRSHLSRANVLATCQKCHAGATRRFAGYLTHATHHDPQKYPLLFWTFWGMTALLLGTFAISGVHTLLWLPRAFQMRKELQAEQELLKNGNGHGAAQPPEKPSSGEDK